MTKVLIVLTSAATTDTGKPAGYYLPEAAHVRRFAPIVSTAEPNAHFVPFSHTILSPKLASTSISPRPKVPTPLSTRGAFRSVCQIPYLLIGYDGNARCSTEL